MVGVKNNRRTQYTIREIQKALINLLNSSPIEKITVTQICELADVNRGTFYRYFLDPYDCLEKIEAQFSDAVSEKMHELPDLPDKDEDVNSFLKSHLVVALEQIQENADLMKMVFLSGHSTMLQNIFSLDNGDHPGPKPLDVSEIKTEKQRNFYYNQEYYANAVLSVIKAWLRLDMPETPSQLADKIVDRIINKFPVPLIEPELSSDLSQFNC